MSRNIWLSYLLVIARFSWFWLGIWVYFYLKFTDYTGIGIIETGLFLTVNLIEIPTGAIADLLGKRMTLFYSFLIQAVGSFVMAYSTGFSMLFFSVFLLAIGSTFYSGTLEALVYDSLKQEGKEKSFGKIISNITSLQLIIPAVCSGVGGFIYLIDPKLPFIAQGFLYAAAMLVCIFLIEPQIDSVKFSLSNFLAQTRQGFFTLFSSDYTRKQVILLLSVSCIMVILDEMLDSILVIEYGFKENQSGIFWAVMFIISAIASQFTTKVSVKFNKNLTFVFTGLIIGIMLITSPFVGMVLGSFAIMIRYIFSTIFGNLTSIEVNELAQSRYRATTISTFNMLRNVPYAITAILVGFLANMYSGRLVAFYLGLSLIVLLLVQLFAHKKSS